MTPAERAKSSILALQQLNNSNFEDIQYASSVVKAVVEYGDFRKITQQEIGSEKKDEISFLEVNLSKVVRGAKIIHNGITWYVEDFTIANGLYKIFCTATTKYGTSRRR